MAHTHPVVDSDSRFVINSTTRSISTTSDKLELIQGDHQSERITFEIPKIVEGHDMSLCDRIEVHYINIDRKTKAQSKDVYIADDIALDGEKVVFSWLISGNATKYYGRLNFIVLFECLDEEGNYTYKWNTEICKLLTVGEGISNTEAISEDYSDILEKFKKEVLGEAKKYTDESKIQADWNQYDETTSDYIRNRICYKDEITFVSGILTYKNGGRYPWYCRDSANNTFTEETLNAFDSAATGHNSIKLTIAYNYYPFNVREYDLEPGGIENGIYYLTYNSVKYIYHDTINNPNVLCFNYKFNGDYGSKVEMKEIALKTISPDLLPKADYQNAGIVPPLKLINDEIGILYGSQPVGYMPLDKLYAPSNFKTVTTLSKANICMAFASYKENEFLVTNSIEDDGFLALTKKDYPIRVSSLGYEYSGEIPISTLRIMKTDFTYADVKFNMRNNGEFQGDVIWKYPRVEEASVYDALQDLSESGLITPVQQNGTFYTSPSGELYIL